MKKNLFIFIFIVFFVQVNFGQKKSTTVAPKIQSQTVRVDDYPNLKMQADDTSKASVSGDFEKIVFFTYPKVVEMVGGKDKMIAFLKTEFGQLKADGFELVAMTIREITQIAKVENQIFAVVPITIKMITPNGKIANEGSLVGISNDKGVNWKFISGINQKRFQTIFPKAAEKLQIPTEQPPKPIENE